MLVQSGPRMRHPPIRKAATLSPLSIQIPKNQASASTSAISSLHPPNFAYRMSGFHPYQIVQQPANLPEQELQDRMPHISYQKSNEISQTQDDCLHISVYLRSLRVEAGLSVSAQISPLPLHDEAGDEDLKRGDDTGNPFRRQSGAETAQPKLYPSAPIQGENTSPGVCSHGT